MMIHPHFDHVPGWFAVLPDCPAAGPLATALSDRADHLTPHPSGRPWLIGRWNRAQSQDEVVVARAGDTVLAVVGQHAVSSEDLARTAARVRTPADLDKPSGQWAGSMHVVASVSGRVRVHGPISCFRRVYRTEIDGVTVAADRADLLAYLSGAELAETRLAVGLIEPFAPVPIGGEPMWRGVAAVPPGDYLAIDRDGRHRQVRWWTAPEPVVPLAQGAVAMREALTAAVEVRTRGRELVTTDLGGHDSTSVCCLAARNPVKVAAYTWQGRDPLADDVLWARRTVAALGNIEHHVIPPERTPFAFDGLGELEEPLDEPCGLTLDRRWLVIAELAAARGSRLHMGGFGGDEVLGGSPAHLHAMLRRSPRTALRNLRGYAAQDRWPYRTAMRQLLDGRPYRSWLRRFAADLTGEPVSSTAPMLEWARPVRLPPWATPAAAAAIRDLIGACASSAEPVGHGHGQHQELAGLQGIARMIRHLGQMAAHRGVTLAAPYYDDRVIEAGLAVRPEERVTPWSYKPLIIAAMRGIVPDESLQRQTKPDGSHEIEVGLRENRAALLALCEDSRLARLGIVDEAVLRSFCSRPLPSGLEFSALYPTLACELWLRSQESSTKPSEETSHVAETT